MTFKQYEIDNDLTVKVYLQGLDTPWILQPNHPDDRDWVDYAEAETFAKEYVKKAAEIYAEQIAAATPAESAPAE